MADIDARPVFASRRTRTRATAGSLRTAYRERGSATVARPDLMQDEAERDDRRQHEPGNGEHIAEVVPEEGNVAPGDVSRASSGLRALGGQPCVARINRAGRPGNLRRIC